MVRLIKKNLLAFLLVSVAAACSFAANTKFTNVEVTGSLTVDGSQTVGANNTVTGNQTVTGKTIGARSTTTSVSTSTVVSPAATFVVLQSTGGAITLGTTPTISTTTATDGQFLIVKGTSSVSTITLQDNGTLSGSLLELGSTTRVVSDLKVLLLFFDSTVGKWVEVAYGNN